MDGDLFDFPKDELVLQEVVEMLTEGDDIVVDFFAGSSTTAHSVMLQNAADGGNRRFVMVQLDEKTSKESAAFQAGFKTIPEVSRERIRCLSLALTIPSLFPWLQNLVTQRSPGRIAVSSPREGLITCKSTPTVIHGVTAKL